MSERGDVLCVKRRLGFGAGVEGERVVVIQPAPLNAMLPTVVVVPLDPEAELFAGQPLAVRIPAREAGAEADHVAVCSWLHTLRADRLEPGRLGKLRDRTLAEIDERLRIVLDL
ncbi:MAG TPA: type II toxin-antitoxin system PemK/MazF family toxin [Polyangiaceae bacterium]